MVHGPSLWNKTVQIHNVCMNLKNCSVSKSPSFGEGELWVAPHVGRAGVKKKKSSFAAMNNLRQLLSSPGPVSPSSSKWWNQSTLALPESHPGRFKKIKKARRGRSFHRTKENPATTCSEWILRWPRESHCGPDLRWFWGLTENFVRVQVAWKLC